MPFRTVVCLAWHAYTLPCSTYRFEVVQVDQDVALCAVRDVLQHIHVLELGRAGALVCVVDHVILVVVAVAIEGQALELLLGLGRRGLEVFEEVNKGSCGCLAMFSVSCCAPCLRTFLLLVVDKRLLGQKRHCVSVDSGVETSGAARGRMGDVQRGGVETRIWAQARCYDTWITRARVANAQSRTPANGSSRVERPAATGILSIGADVASAGGGARAPGLGRRLRVVVAVILESLPTITHHAAEEACWQRRPGGGRPAAVAQELPRQPAGIAGLGARECERGKQPSAIVCPHG